MDIKKIESSFKFIGNKIEHLEIENGFLLFPKREDLTNYIDVEYEIAAVYKTEDSITGYLKLYINIEIKKNDEENPCSFKANLILAGAFVDDPAIDEESFRSMLSLNGSAALYGIARAFILSISAQCAENARITIPMVNFFKMREEKAKAPDDPD